MVHLPQLRAETRIPKCRSGQSKERTETRSMHEILPLPAGAWQEPCGLRYSESGF